MRLIRYRDNGIEKPGVILDNGKKVDISRFGEDYTESFFTGNGIERLSKWLIKQEDASLIEGPVQLAPPIVRPGKIICIGLNYCEHAKEGGMTVPDEPVIFMKATSAICGPNDDLVIPPGSKKTDWEVELGVVIGKKASYINEENAMDYVAGYVLHNDYSEREYQLERGGQWVKGKSCDTFAPLGPWLITKDEIDDVHNLNMWLTVNGEVKQNGHTSDMIFKVPFIISYVSQFMSLLPGDIISTGTPAGVGLGLKPQQFLKPGDIVELGIDKLGSSRQRATLWNAVS